MSDHEDYDHGYGDSSSALDCGGWAGCRGLCDPMCTAALEAHDPREDEGSATAYQRWTDETAIGGYPEAGTGSRMAINYAVIGLNDEAGEVAGKWKKLLRGDDVNDEARQARIAALQDEVGDVLWYAARIAEETGTTLDELMQRNRAKLMDRKRRGVIKGDGDKR